MTKEKGKGFKITAGVFFILLFLIAVFSIFLNVVFFPFLSCILEGEDILYFIRMYPKDIFGDFSSAISFINILVTAAFSAISAILMSALCFAKLDKKKGLTVLGIYLGLSIISPFLSKLFVYIREVSFGRSEFSDIIEKALTGFFDYFQENYFGNIQNFVINFGSIIVSLFVIAYIVMMLIGKAKEKRAFFITAIVLSSVCALLAIALRTFSFVNMIIELTELFKEHPDIYIHLAYLIPQNIISFILSICSGLFTCIAFVFLNIGEMRALSKAKYITAPDPVQFFESPQSEKEPAPGLEPKSEPEPVEKASAEPVEGDIERKLHTLKRMHENGVISDEQYESSKKELLEKFINV